MANTTAANWDESSPALGDPRRSGATEIRVLRAGVATRLGKEHETPAALGVGGEHKAGSAVSYIQSAAPTLRPDGLTSLSSSDAGRLWVDTDTMVIKVWDGNSWELFGSGIENFFQGVTNPISLPITKSSLANGTWMVILIGVTAASGNPSITIQSQTRTLDFNTHPGVKVPFTLLFGSLSVSAGTMSITAASNIDRIESFIGFRTS